ncbi:hypothetical protein ILUMI_16172, partial [Ignelater luminosus]
MMTRALIEKLKRSRKAARVAFTRALTAFNEEIRQEEPIVEEVQVTFQILEARSFELDALNTKICEVMVELTAEKEDHERIMEDEYEVAAEYTTKYLRAKIEVTKLKRASQPEQTPQIYQQIRAGDNADSKRKFKLPKIELKKFGGDLKDWLQFWSQFKNIHEDKSITTEDKFQYLIQAMIPNSRAADLVNSFPPSQNYDKVINSLKNRFGKDELLVEVYVRKLLPLVISKAIKSKSLGVTKDKCAAMLYPLVESSLPEELIRTWQRQATAIKSDNIEESLTKLTEFLQSQCGKRHSILLCREILNKDNSLRETTSEDLNKHNKEANLANVSLMPEVCLQTIRVILKNDNKERVVRAIMDSGSQRSYISKQAAEEMEYQLHCENRVVQLLFDNEYACNFIAFNQDIICHGIPSINNEPWVHELVKRNIILTDVGQ